MEKKDRCLMSVIRPIVIVNQIVGVCPHEICGEILIFRWKSFKFFRTILTFIIMSLYTAYLIVQFFLSFQRNRPLPEKVNLALWAGGSLLPICMLMVTFIKRNRMTLFFEKMQEYKTPLKGMISCEKTVRYSRKLYTMYLFLTFVACGFVANIIIRNPKTDISILAYMEGEPSPSQLAFACCFQCYIVIVKSCAIGYIEVLCCSLATSFCNTVDTIQIELQKSLDGESPRFQGPFSTDNKIRMNSKDLAASPYVQKVNETRHNDMYPVIPTVDDSGRGDKGDLSFSIKPHPINSVDGYENYYSEYVADGTWPIILAMKRFNCIANMQRLMNCIFGQLLLIDTGFLVFMSCLLLFLQINNVGSGVVDSFDVIIFTVNFLAFFIRTVVIFISLGAVYNRSVCFNGILTSSLMQVKKPKAMDVNLILAHLSTHSANPVSFSAAGFFTFSKSSLFAVMSGIMTYVVFLLQAKN